MNLQFSSNSQSQQCLQCSKSFPANILNFMVDVNMYICKQCQKLQAKVIMEYKKNNPKSFPEYDQIQEGLYLGNEDAATDIQTFQKTGVQAVCVCGSYLQMPFTQKLHYKQHIISDATDQKIIHLFDENNSWIEEMKQKNKKILVHCAAGVSRSASFVIAYIMKSRELSYIEAHALVKSKRAIIFPNSGFIKQLQQYEKYLLQSKVQEVNEE